MVLFVMDMHSIPKVRENVSNADFKKQLEQRKATNQIFDNERYANLKYEVIKWAVIGIPFAILGLITSNIWEMGEIGDYCKFYLQTVATLYVGSLIGNDFHK